MRATGGLDRLLRGISHGIFRFTTFVWRTDSVRILSVMLFCSSTRPSLTGHPNMHQGVSTWEPSQTARANLLVLIIIQVSKSAPWAPCHRDPLEDEQSQLCFSLLTPVHHTPISWPIECSTAGPVYLLAAKKKSISLTLPVHNSVFSWSKNHFLRTVVNENRSRNTEAAENQRRL